MNKYREMAMNFKALWDLCGILGGRVRVGAGRWVAAMEQAIQGFFAWADREVRVGNTGQGCGWHGNASRVHCTAEG